MWVRNRNDQEMMMMWENGINIADEINYDNFHRVLLGEGRRTPLML